MRSPREFLRLFVRAAFKAAGSQGGVLVGGAVGAVAGGVPGAVLGAVAADFMGSLAEDMARDLWRAWGTGRPQAELRAELQAVAGADLAREVQQVVREEGEGKPEGVRNTVAALAEQLPQSIRVSQRRPADPSGRTVLPDLQLRGPADLLPLLPARLPHFRPGPLPGTDWELEELLGVGGFGEVWKARNPLRQVAALKFCLDAQAAKTLKNEVELLRRVQQEGNHPGLVRLLDTALKASPPFLVYEYVPGGDLGAWMLQRRGQGGVGVKEAARLLLRLARIVAFAHARGITHRDLKPGNVLVCQGEGEVALKVVDFGIGRIEAEEGLKRSKTMRTTGLTLLVRSSYTPLYASPEQKKGHPAAPTDDVYALGMIWYQLVTGDLEMTDLPADWWQEVRAKEMPQEQVELLERCLAGKAEKRPPDAGELARELARLLKERDPVPVKNEEARSWVRAASIALALALVLAGALFFARRRSGPENDLADSDKNSGQTGRPRETQPVTPGVAMLPTLENGIGMKFVQVPAGKFWRGSRPGEGSDDERPRREVTISEPFYLGVYEVTQGQYRRVMKDNPSRFKVSDNHPVENVSHHDAVKFCRELGELPEEKEAGRTYRLPWEAEWEYACRAGTDTRFYTGDRDADLARAGWYDGNSEGKTHPVGQKEPNAWGLFDMHGNVWEWCADWYDSRAYDSTDIADHKDTKIGTSRVFRGGSRSGSATFCRAAYRSGNWPGFRGGLGGFRVVCVVPDRTR